MISRGSGFRLGVCVCCSRGCEEPQSVEARKGMVSLGLSVAFQGCSGVGEHSSTCHNPPKITTLVPFSGVCRVSVQE